MTAAPPIHGTWLLSAFDIAREASRPWGAEVHGVLIYSPDQHMSVSINKRVEPAPSESESQNTLDSILFYAGSYTVEGDVIRHKVTNASDPARIGRDLIRYFKLKGDTLTLRTPEESYGRAILVWKRA